MSVLASAANSSSGIHYIERADVQTFMHQLETEDHFDAAALTAIFTEARFRPDIIEAMDRPFKQPPPWYQYAHPLLNQDRLQQGLLFWNAHKDTLARAEEEFGVPASVIVAIIGIETSYGRVTGNYRLIDALSTLAFDYPRRSHFFRDELHYFLILTRNERLDPSTIKGSFAGALGMAQFMPSSYLQFGIDFDHDGHIDLLHSPNDSIGSIAHFLQIHGWQHNSWDVRPVKQLPLAILEQETLNRGISEWRTQKTWEQIINSNPTWPDDLNPNDHFALMKLETRDGSPYFIWVGPNFQAITQYNRSRLYASAVWTLACELAEAQGASRCAVHFPI